MEPQDYILEEVKKDKRKNMAGIITWVILILIGLVMVISGIVNISNITAEDVSKISYTDIETGKEYFFDEMVLVDVYTVYGDKVLDFESDDYRDYLVAFIDKDGTVVYTSIRPEKNSDLADKCKAYIKDKNQAIGDVILTGCFHATTNDSTTHRYLEDSYEDINAEIPGELLDLTFSYDAETIEDYQGKESLNQSPLFILAGFIIMIGVICVFSLIRKRKKFDQYLVNNLNTTNQTNNM